MRVRRFSPVPIYIPGWRSHCVSNSWVVPIIFMPKGIDLLSYTTDHHNNLLTRHAAMAERKVNMDQRRTENTLSTNRQSDLEKEYKNDFRDGKRVDATEAIEAKMKKTRRTGQLPPADQLKAYRLSCYIFEVTLVIYQPLTQTSLFEAYIYFELWHEEIINICLLFNVNTVKL